MEAKNSNLYATGSDFCRIFKEDMRNLYLLSLLLTADSEKAEQCFVSGLDDCASGNQVFKEWARSWARRMVIKNAIRLVAPEPVANHDSNAIAARAAGDHLHQEVRAYFSAVLGLEAFERFAFVTSVLEGYSDRDSTLLLGCSREDLIAARSRALQKIAHSDTQAGATLKPEPLHERSSSILELKIPRPLATTA